MMMYLIVTPDYNGLCIKDEFDGQLEIEKLGLSREYITAITLWNLSYRAIIPLSEEQRKTRKKEIERLDKDGIELSKKLQKLVPGGAKVKYFSEGLMRYLPVV